MNEEERAALMRCSALIEAYGVALNALFFQVHPTSRADVIARLRRCAAEPMHAASAKALEEVASAWEESMYR